MIRFACIGAGIGSAALAWRGLGWRPVGFAEAEPFARSVLATRFPDVPLFATIAEPSARAVFAEADVIAIGPRVACWRDVMEECDAIDDIRRNAGKARAWIIGQCERAALREPGNGFGAVLARLCGRGTPIATPRGGWTDAGVVAGPGRGAAWRLVDARHWGVARRYERVILLAGGSVGDRFASADALVPIRAGSNGNPGAVARRARGDSAADPASVDGGILVFEFVTGGEGGPARPHIIVAEESIKGAPTIRRVSPDEYESLSGIPVGHTMIEHGGKPARDLARYAAIRDAQPPPLLRALGQRIAAVHGMTGATEAA